MVSYFLWADWGNDPAKRSVYVAEIGERRIRRCSPSGVRWSAQALLESAARLAARGPVLVGADMVLGVPEGYWRRVAEAGGKTPESFVEWLADTDPEGGFFGEAAEAGSWCPARPWFRVAPGRGGLTAFTAKVEGGMLRRIDGATGGKPVFAVSGIPGTVESGTREFWRELGPLLSGRRESSVWPF